MSLTNGMSLLAKELCIVNYYPLFSEFLLNSLELAKM